MTPADFRTAVATLGWTWRHIEDLTGVDERQVRRWAAGATVPPHIAEWLARAARELPPLMALVDEWHEKNPVPPKKSD